MLFVLRCVRPELARLRHAGGHGECLLIGADRKWSVHRQNDEIGPPMVKKLRLLKGGSVPTFVGLGPVLHNKLAVDA
jgi:hypothetical protein